ncbi:MAG TPA: hypothetical protein VIF11_15855 [Methylomirabilota bacterium]
MRAVAEFMPTLHARRRSLHAPFHDAEGDLVMPAMPQLLARPPKRAQTDRQDIVSRRRRAFGRCYPIARAPAKERADFDYRRSDGMAVICRVLTAMVAYCQWTTQEVRDPQSGFLGVRRIAKLARCSFDQAQRAIHWLGASKILCFTQQFREEQADGSFKATGNALRKLAVSWFKSIPSVNRIFEARRKKLKERASKASKRAAREGIAAPIIEAQEARNPIIRGVPIELTDKIAAEHEDWSATQIFEEARRLVRESQGPPKT